MKKNAVEILFVLLIVFSSLFGQSQYVSTYSGNQTSGYVNGSVGIARYNYPYGLTFDGNNSIYVADAFNNVIRKIDLTTGVVSTLAGNGTAGFVDASGMLARFNIPTGVFYKNGFVYVSDNSNNAIRKIDVSTGDVTTVAGNGNVGSTNGAALSATFFEPKSLVVDSLEDIYVADYGNNVIRKISGGIVTTFAGSGVQGFQNGALASAKFYAPRDLALDQMGNLYVADQNNNRIRKISGGMVTTYAGTGVLGGADGTSLTATFNTPTGIEFFNGEMFVTDCNGNKVRKITAGGAVSTIAGTGVAGYINGIGTSARFNILADLTIDNNG